MESENNQKKTNRFVAFLKAVFVHNIGWKLLAIASSFILWALVAGLW